VVFKKKNPRAATRQGLQSKLQKRLLSEIAQIDRDGSKTVADI
jgi:hypothetical protein